MRLWMIALCCWHLMVGTVVAQTADGQLQVTLVNQRGQPVAGQALRFVAERDAFEARCTTGPHGTCTLVLVGVPRDAAGFVRGTLLVAGHGERPVIWPGGGLSLTLTLGAGELLHTPVDVLATRTPRPTATAPQAPRSGPEQVGSVPVPPPGRPTTPFPATTAVPLPKGQERGGGSGHKAVAGDRGGSPWVVGLLGIGLVGLGVYAVWRKEQGR